MLNLIVVDDNKKRSQMIVDGIKARGFESRLSLTLCESADQARLELKNVFDLMVLDVVLPKKIGGVPQALNSFNLLKDMCHANNRYLKPDMIIGLTADIKDIAKYRSEFGERFITVTEGAMNSLDWLNKILGAVGDLLAREQKVITSKVDKLLITVHGIRTYGKWQKSLGDSLEAFSRDFKCVEMKYEFFDLVSFAIPYLRERRAERIAKQMVSVLNKHSDKNIYIVAHSYGTYIASKALHGYSSERKIKRTVFCGSPLCHDHDIDHVVEKSELTINECGTSDAVLVLSRMLVIGMGDAGRVGFSRENGSEFINRYYPGGHSLYFAENKTPTFYETYWTPLFITDAGPIYADSRKNYFGEDFLDLFIKLFSKIKSSLYVAAMVAAVFFLVK